MPMLTCKEASELVSQSYERRLSWRQRLGLRLHLMICDGCTQFARQLRFLRAAARSFDIASTQGEASQRLSPLARKRIADTLNGQARPD
jgi:hypothetical protein